MDVAAVTFGLKLARVALRLGSTRTGTGLVHSQLWEWVGAAGIVGVSAVLELVQYQIQMETLVLV